MREIVCPVCEGKSRAVVFKSTLPSAFDEAVPPPPYSGHYQINRCLTCELMMSSPVMNDVGVAALYKDSSETNVSPGEEDNVRRTMALYYHLASPHLAGRQRMLDIGCDMGFLLEAAKADGFAEVFGIEPNPVARKAVEQTLGAKISDRFFEDTDYPADYFDLVSMIHVLDHLFDPRIVLGRALSNLRPGGVIVAVVHNADALLYKLLGEKYPIFNFYHHYFFSKKTLAALFRSQGYEVVRVVSTYNCYSLGFFAKRVPGVPEFLRKAAFRVLDFMGLASVALTIPVGNIGIVARRPLVG